MKLLEHVTRKRSCSIVIQKEAILLVALRDDRAHKTFWVPPGGEIESHESPAQTAVRETLEETGYRVRPVQGKRPWPRPVSYAFVWRGTNYWTTTFFIPCRLESPERVSVGAREKYIIQAKWWPLKQGLNQLKHHPAIYLATAAAAELFL